MDDDEFFAQIARATIPKSKNPNPEQPTSASRKRTRSSAPVFLGGSIISSNVVSGEVILIDDDSDFVVLPKKNSDKLDKKKGNTNLTLEEELELFDAEEKGSKKKKKGDLSFAIPEENAVLHETKNLQKKLFDRIARLQSGGPFIDSKKKTSSSSDKIDDVEEVIDDDDDDDPIPKKTAKKIKSTANDKTKETTTNVRKIKITFRTIDNILPAITIKAFYTAKMEKLFSAVKKEWISSGKISIETFKQVIFKANGEKLTTDMLVSSIADEDIESVQVDVFLPK
jgi:hypothetical protein